MTLHFIPLDDFAAYMYSQKLCKNLDDFAAYSWKRDWTFIYKSLSLNYVFPPLLHNNSTVPLWYIHLFSNVRLVFKQDTLVLPAWIHRICAQLWLDYESSMYFVWSYRSLEKQGLWWVSHQRRRELMAGSPWRPTTSISQLKEVTCLHSWWWSPL